MNDLVWNLKIDVSQRNKWRYCHKERAISRAGKALLKPFRKFKNTGNVTIVPVPPSKAMNDPEYDDRILQIANILAEGSDAEVREVVRQTETYVASHTVTSGERKSPEDLVAIYRIPKIAPTPRPVILILDDVLTRGAHFRAMKTVLATRFPQSKIVGLFLARSIAPPAEDAFDAFGEFS